MHAKPDKAYKGIGMEGRIATWYAKNTRKDMDHFQSLAERLSKTLPQNSRILEIAPGPGYLALELAKCGHYEISGLDISSKFVEIAKQNAQKENLDIDFQRGNASAMSFADNSFDFIVCRAAFKNFSQPVQALNEMYRVLKPGGRALIIDLRKDASMHDINDYIKQADLDWKNAMIYKLTFRYLLIPRAYTRQQLTEMVSASYFKACEIDASGLGFEIRLHK